MIYSDLLTKIKREAQLNSSSQYDDAILEIVNDELLKLCQKQNYSECEVFAHTIACADATGYVALPTNFLRLIPGTMSFVDSEGEVYPLKKSTGREMDKLWVQARPAIYHIANRRINFLPYEDVTTDDSIKLSYYKSISISSPSEELPDIFASTVQAESIFRLLLMKDSKAAGAYKMQAKEAFINSLGSR